MCWSKQRWLVRVGGLVLTLCLASACAASAEQQDDVAIAEPVRVTLHTWTEERFWLPTIAAFEAEHPGIQIEVKTTSSEFYDAEVDETTAAGTAADLIVCRGFDSSLKYFDEGVFEPLGDLEGLDRFSPLDSAAFTTDDGLETFCVPVAGVTQAIAYNANILDELGISVPKTQAEFQQALEKVAADGRYVPFSIGMEGRNRVATYMVWEVLGADNWKGEEGRFGLISQTQLLTDPGFVASLSELEEMATTFPEDPRMVSRREAIMRFRRGEAAFVPIGSWEIWWAINGAIGFKGGLMAVPSDDPDRCYVVDHADFGVALHADARHPEEAKVFLRWLTTSAFAEVFFDEGTGFFSLQRDAAPPKNPGLNSLKSAVADCESTERLTVQLLSRGAENMDDLAGAIVGQVLAGELDAGAAAAALQDAVDEYYVERSD